MGGNKKFRALRLKEGNFGWSSEGVARQTRIVDVVYNAVSNEMIRTNTPNLLAENPTGNPPKKKKPPSLELKTVVLKP